MSTRYVEINSADFEKFLADNGFVRTESGSEVVYVKNYAPFPVLQIKVYTSIRIGRTKARDVGEDAIRVVAINTERDVGIAKLPRVYRTGSQEAVFSRTLERIQEAEQRCEKWTKLSGNYRRPAEVNQNPFVGSYVGNIREEIRFTAKIIEKLQYGKKFLFKMLNNEGNILFYWTEKELLQVGNMYELSATVNGHTTFKGVKQTGIINCRGKKI